MSAEHIFMMNARLNSCILRDAMLARGLFCESELTGSDFTNANLSQANFQKAELRKCHLDHVEFNQVVLVGVNMSESTLCGTKVKDTALTPQTLHAVYLDGATLPTAAKELLEMGFAYGTPDFED